MIRCARRKLTALGIIDSPVRRLEGSLPYSQKLVAKLFAESDESNPHAFWRRNYFFNFSTPCI